MFVKTRGIKKEENLMIKQKIVEKILKDDHVSFVEIEKIFKEEGFDFEGDQTLLPVKQENLIIWGGWNVEAVNIIHEILATEPICMQNTGFLTYFIDGGFCELPIAKKLKNYKTLRWIPMVFRAESNI